MLCMSTTWHHLSDNYICALNIIMAIADALFNSKVRVIPRHMLRLIRTYDGSSYKLPPSYIRTSLRIQTALCKRTTVERGTSPFRLVDKEIFYVRVIIVDFGTIRKTHEAIFET